MGKYEGICKITSITNAQNWHYWADKQLYHYMLNDNEAAFDDRKNYLKKRAFEIVADQTGKIFKPEIFTIVWARRFAGYKRADLITRNEERFSALLANKNIPYKSYGQVNHTPWTILPSPILIN